MIPGHTDISVTIPTLKTTGTQQQQLTHIHGVLGHTVLLRHRLEHGLDDVGDDHGLHAGDAGEGVEVDLADTPGTDDACDCR